MAQSNRTCHVCGQRYYYCTSGSCQENIGKPPWMVMFHDENCKKIWDLMGDYCVEGKVSDDEAIKILLQLNMPATRVWSEDVDAKFKHLLKMANKMPNNSEQDYKRRK